MISYGYLHHNASKVVGPLRLSERHLRKKNLCQKNQETRCPLPTLETVGECQRRLYVDQILALSGSKPRPEKK